MLCGKCNINFLFCRSDQEIVGLALEALCNVVATDPNADVELKAGQSITDAELGVQFTEIFLKKAENITSLLELLEVGNRL